KLCRAGQQRRNVQLPSELRAADRDDFRRAVVAFESATPANGVDGDCDAVSLEDSINRPCTTVVFVTPTDTLRERQSCGGTVDHAIWRHRLVFWPVAPDLGGVARKKDG